jgi:hypothetical protein
MEQRVEKKEKNAKKRLKIQATHHGRDRHLNLYRLTTVHAHVRISAVRTGSGVIHGEIPVKVIDRDELSAGRAGRDIVECECASTARSWAVADVSHDCDGRVDDARGGYARKGVDSRGGAVLLKCGSRCGSGAGELED